MKIMKWIVAAFLLLVSGAVCIAQTPDEGVKIGVLTDMSSAYADTSGHGAVVAAEMAIKDFGGSVLGKPIKLLSADHQSKVDVGVNIARQWYETDGVDVIVDISTSPVGLAVQSLAADKKRLALNTTSATELLTNEACSAFGAHWTFDSYSMGKTAAAGIAKPGSTWFFITVDNAGGRALQDGLTKFLDAAGAKVIGSVRHPFNTADFSSFVLQAQQSGAQFVALANSGADLQNTIKQASEFGLTKGGQTLVGIAVFISDLKAVGLELAGGLVFSTAFVSDANPEAAAWSKRFAELYKSMPNDTHAGIYSSVLHYLRAVQASGTKDAATVIAKMRETPVNDIFAQNGTLRKDGRMVHDMYMVRAKQPSESSGPTDLLEIVKKIPGDEAFRPLSESKCPLVKGAP